VSVSGNGNVIVNCQQATVHAAGSVTLDTPSTHMTGNLQVDGNMGVTGSMAVQGQGSSGAVSTFAGTIQVTGGDVKADGIGLKSHTHTDPQGGTVGPAQG
jgi:phage gp45-like